MCLGADLGTVIREAFAAPRAEAVDMNIPNIRRLEV
jgi:hypothetical protein